ncbi:MAG: lasso peptide biosynthesis B2 protein [Bacteroidales bacterium]|nr:lasso peptide biosynthesis B2 protein [Bacteroidales bacterium]
MGLSVHRFVRLSYLEKVMFAEALLFLYLSGLLVLVLPFRKIVNLFERKVVSDPLSSERPTRVKLVSSALRRAGQLAWWKNKCFISSLAGKIMLNRRKILSNLYLGATFTDDGKLKAHAWLNAGDIEVVKKDGDFAELYIL